LHILASKSTSPSSPVVNGTVNNNDPVEATVEISLNNRRLTILSTASIPLKRATCDPFVPISHKTEPEVHTILDDSDSQESQSIDIIQEHKVQTIIPRRRQQTSANETVYNLYKQRLMNNEPSAAQKRLSSKDIESSKSKKLKEPAELVILD
jgi:hypothetical protein